jgi:hypothetical protein
MTDLSQFAQLYMMAAVTHAPRKLEDMPELERDMPRVYKAIQSGDYVVVWGADPNRAPQGASRTVLAYVKDAPEKGGMAAFLDGGVRQVSADELKQALGQQK